MLNMLMVVTKDRKSDRALDAECVECAISRVKLGYAPALRSLTRRRSIWARRCHRVARPLVTASRYEVRARSFPGRAV